ncbi:MAG: cardiolipin synthase [Bacillota bacterium]
MHDQIFMLTTIFGSIAVVLNFLFAFVVIFFERRNPSGTWAWLLVLFFLPIIGFFVYLLIGQQGNKEKMFREKGEFDAKFYNSFLLNDHEVNNEKLQQQKKIVEGGGRVINEQHLTDLAYLHLNSGNFMTYNNDITMYSDGNDKFGNLLKDIENAKTFVHLQYYIWRNDDLGKKLVAAMAKKAAEGVEVRLNYDGMGNPHLPKDFFTAFHAAGGQTVAFLPPLVARVNYRNHRKLAIIDGEIGYIGGFNVGDEYLGRVKRYGNWRDLHFRVTGDAVDQMQIRFTMDWNFSIKEESKKIPLETKYFPKREQFDGVKMQIVSSGPDTKYRNIRNGYDKMITEAENHVYLVTPYFVPDDGIFENLRVAALSGIDVRIIIPGNPDHPFVYWSSLSYLGELLDAGVRCFQYTNGFIHAKVLSIDGTVSSVGTANMDIRSFDVNFEVNSFVYDTKIAKQVEDQFLKDLQDCEELTLQWYENRSLLFRMKESISRLISPML